MFECYFLKKTFQIISIVKKVHNNLKIELMQWQAHSVRGSLFENNKIYLGREKGTWTINLSNLKFEVLFQFLIKIG